MNYNIFCGYYGMTIDQVETSSKVTAYHITRKDNIDNIRRDGLKAQPCKATQSGDYRQDAVYLFAAHQDAHDQQLQRFLFDDTDDLVILQVSIPASAYVNLTDDGIFNMSAICTDGSFPTAMQYFGDIPADWIK